METLVLVSRLVVALGLLNVWLLRRDKATSWRGGTAKNMREEFTAYGLPPWCFGVVGGLKVALSILLIVGIWVPSVTRPAAIGIAILMLGAIAMHLKVKDPAQKSLPASLVLALCLIVVFA